jgi:hypothetical protein
MGGSWGGGLEKIYASQRTRVVLGLEKLKQFNKTLLAKLI